MNDTDRDARDTDPAPPDTVRVEPDPEFVTPEQLASMQADFRDALAGMVVVIPQLFADLETAPLAWHSFIGGLRALGATDEELDRIVKQTDAGIQRVISAETEPTPDTDD